MKSEKWEVFCRFYESMKHEKATNNSQNLSSWIIDIFRFLEVLVYRYTILMSILIIFDIFKISLMVRNV